jgi:hypothetical protein
MNLEIVEIAWLRCKTCEVKGPWRQPVIDAQLDRVQMAFRFSLRKSTWNATQELIMPHAAERKILFTDRIMWTLWVP